jgi:hypothetical protein
VLDELSDLLVEFDNVGSSVDEVLDMLPFKEVGLGFLGTSTERADQFAKDLRSFECLRLWLFNSQNVRVHVQLNFFESINHLSLDFFWRQLLWL